MNLNVLSRLEAFKVVVSFLKVSQQQRLSRAGAGPGVGAGGGGEIDPSEKEFQGKSKNDVFASKLFFVRGRESNPRPSS